MLFSENDKYLINENYKNGCDDFLQLFIADRAFIVPYKYVKQTGNNGDAISEFERELFDFEADEVLKYKNARENIKTVIYDDRVYVVPFDKRNDNMSAKKVAEMAVEKADMKYNMIINTHRKLNKRGSKVGLCSFSSKNAKNYVEEANESNEVVLLDNKSESMYSVLRFLGTLGEKGIEKFNTTTSKLQNKIKKKIIETEFGAIKKFVTDNYKIGALVLALGVGGIATHNMIEKNNDKTKGEAEVNVLSVKDNPNDGKYITFTGRELDDKHGNIALINGMREDVTILMTAVEGFTDIVFDDGTGVCTTGIGLTYTLDEKGNEYPITKDDKLSENELLVNKWRYIEKNLLPIVSSIDRKCSKEELMSVLGAGFCWGPSGLKNSNFLKSVKNDESVDQQTRKLTGFRKPIGLLKREYLLACILNKKWNIDDIKEMPVYYVKDKGYVHCAIYTLDFSDITPCKKNKKGEFIKDKLGHKVPKVDEDGYCSLYLDRSGSILNKLKQGAIIGNTSNYLRVGELLSDNSYSQLRNDIALSDSHRDVLISCNNAGDSKNIFELYNSYKDRG